jgi:hypothetical protein
MKSHMYAEAKTWNVGVGCLYGCIYCKVSFQQQVKRWGKKNCGKCYEYLPHEHLERLKRIPSAKIVFVCGDGDISFFPYSFTRKIIERIEEHNKICPCKTYYFQSKNPKYFQPLLRELPRNAVLLTTLETNRDKGYEKISKAPLPSVRYHDFLSLNYPRKALTLEPLMDFDLPLFLEWIVNLKPEYVWIGFNSRPKQVCLPEPSMEKTRQLIDSLKAKGIEVRGKELRGLKI